MDYKILYGLIFTPILIILLYMGYLQYNSEKHNPELSQLNNYEYMNSNNQNFAQIERDKFKAELESGEISIILDFSK